MIPTWCSRQVHIYHSFTPLGIPVDEYCLGRGCTTVASAGDAGAPNWPGFDKFVVGAAPLMCQTMH
eukprot:SAG11_NODE_10102_length_855_cov_0.728836_2_plen_66_part_00